MNGGEIREAPKDSLWNFFSRNAPAPN